MIDISRHMRWIREMVRRGGLHRDAEAIVSRLLHWRPKHLNYADVSIAAIAKALHISRRKVVKLIEQLETLGFVKKVRRWAYCPRRRKKLAVCNRYVFNPAPPEFRTGTAISPRVIPKAVDKLKRVLTQAFTGDVSERDSVAGAVATLRDWGEHEKAEQLARRFGLAM